MTNKVEREVAEAEFDRFAELMDIEVDTADMDEEDKKGFLEQRERIVKAVMSGALHVNESGEPVFTPTRTADATALTFHEPTGATLMAMDRKKRTEDVGKLFTTMADMTKQPAHAFSKMKMSDLKVCMAITTLFLV